jgi:N utilization substance protein A
MDAFNAHAAAVHRDQAAGPPNLWAKSMGLADDLAAVPGLTSLYLEALAAHGVRLLDDLADLASDELLEIVGSQSMTQKQADAVIMAARAHWFQDLPPDVI